MKKYTNKVLIIGIALFLAAATILFFIKVHEMKVSHAEELIINY